MNAQCSLIHMKVRVWRFKVTLHWRPLSGEHNLIQANKISVNLPSEFISVLQEMISHVGSHCGIKQILPYGRGMSSCTCSQVGVCQEERRLASPFSHQPASLHPPTHSLCSLAFSVMNTCFVNLSFYPPHYKTCPHILEQINTVCSYNHSKQMLTTFLDEKPFAFACVTKSEEHTTIVHEVTITVCCARAGVQCNLPEGWWHMCCLSVRLPAGNWKLVQCHRSDGISEAYRAKDKQA